MMDELPRTADAVIIGAGVIGCSTAYHLARLGMCDVVVLEMGVVGSGSSGKSASILSLQLFPDETMASLARTSYARHMHLEEELGAPVGFRRHGRLGLATERHADVLRTRAERLQGLGIAAELIGPEQIKRMYPQINVDDIACGTWSTESGTLDPHLIMWGFMKNARALGADLREGVRATGIVTGNGQVQGVSTTEGMIWTPRVVNAAGPWASEVGSWAGVDIPILNRARTVLVTGPFPDLPHDWPFVKDEEVQWYCRREGPGILMGMGEAPVESLDVPFQTEMVDEIIDAAVHRVPVLEQASLLTGWTGVRPLSPDGHPMLGPVRGVEGLVLNCGWGGEGIILAPMAGQLAAEYVTNGCTTALDVDELTVERFWLDG